MKNKIKILIASCIMLLCAGNVSAQWRFGVEYEHTFFQHYVYDSNGIYLFKNLTPNAGNVALFTTEYILPREWTPNWLSLSVRGQLGCCYFAENTFFQGDFQIDGENYCENEPTGIMIPIDIEAKLLLSNSIRFFVNGGIPNMINVDGGPFRVGYELGVGFEFGFFRIGYKNLNLNNTFISGNRGNKYNNMHTLTGAFIFNGNRFLKKKSSLKAY